MEQNRKGKEVVKRAYAPPCVETYAVAPGQFMNVSGQHNIGGDDGEISDAKALHLNISFTDPWNSWEE